MTGDAENGHDNSSESRSERDWFLVKFDWSVDSYDLKCGAKSAQPPVQDTGVFTQFALTINAKFVWMNDTIEYFGNVTALNYHREIG